MYPFNANIKVYREKVLSLHSLPHPSLVFPAVVIGVFVASPEVLWVFLPSPTVVVRAGAAAVAVAVAGKTTVADPSTSP